jgi:hypothetical protein
MPFVWSGPSHIFEFPRNSSSGLDSGLRRKRAAIERFAAAESLAIIEEYVRNLIARIKWCLGLL